MISQVDPGTPMGMSDFIGGRGEAIAFACLTRFCRSDSDLPYFWPHFLGEKCETFDFLVELVDAGESTPFFFAQVKTTRKEFTKTQTPPRLRIEVAEKDVRRMAACPAPTYVVGVHEPEGRAFLVGVQAAMSGAIPSITTAHELTSDTLRRLWDEVREFWRTREMSQPASSFLD
jgi:Domain of unknown function (DUF4365)